MLRRLFVDGTHPGRADEQKPAIIYPDVLISKGSLKGPEGVGVTAGAASVSVGWSDNSEDDNANAGGAYQAVTLVYSPALPQYSYSLDGGLCSAGSQDITLSASFSAQPVHVWLGFVSADGKKASRCFFIITRIHLIFTLSQRSFRTGFSTTLLTRALLASPGGWASTSD